MSEGPDGSTGSSNEFAIDYEKGAGDTFRVGISEDEVEGTGDQWRAAGWNAAAVATILTGAPLSGVRVNYDVNGRIDGPSAGALMTVGLLSLIRGDKIKPGITMTGTINPDGTVGPVGGIPYKVDGAKQAKAKTMLIPLGQRNSADDSGELVDVIDIGERKGVKVKEVGDIYAAYKAFTGKTLARPKQTNDVSLSNDDYKQIKARVKGQLADFQSAAGEFNSLDPAVQNELTWITSQANDAKDRAQSLSDNGSQAGAYSEALSAAALANAAVRVGQLYQVLLTQGVGPFVEQVKSSEAVEGKVEALFDQLKATKTKTVSDASNSVNAYSNAIDALSAASFGDNLIQQAKTVGELEPALTKAIQGAVFYEIAGSQVEGTKDILEVGKGQGGAKIDKSVDVEAVADFYRKAADANLERVQRADHPARGPEGRDGRRGRADRVRQRGLRLRPRAGVARRAERRARRLHRQLQGRGVRQARRSRLALHPHRRAAVEVLLTGPAQRRPRGRGRLQRAGDDQRPRPRPGPGGARGRRAEVEEGVADVGRGLVRGRGRRP